MLNSIMRAAAGALASLAVVAHAGAGTSAATNASASLADFSVTLVDLAPDDGRAPWIDFAADGQSRAWAYAYSGVGERGDVDSITELGGGPWSATSADAQTVRGAAQADLLNPGSLLSGMSLHASAQAVGPAIGGLSDLKAGYAASVVAPFGEVGQFTLAPMTRIEISAVASMHVGVAEGWAGDWQGSDSYAQAWMRLLVPVPAVPSVFSIDGCAIAAAMTTGTETGPGGGCGSFVGGSRGFDGLLLRVVLDNLSDDPMVANFTALVSISGNVHTNPSPVPEPHALLMFLCGLTVLWCASARRRARRPARSAA